MPVSLEKKPDPRLSRFKRAAMLIGGCLVNDDGSLVERPGWLTYAAHFFGVDKSNLAKVIAGQRLMTPEIEAQMISAIHAFRENEIRRHKQIVLLQTDYNMDLRQIALDNLAEFTNDGPAPGFGG